MKTQFIYPNIEAERTRKGMSQSDLAKLLGVERKTYYNWLTKGNIPAPVVMKLADVFQCSMDYLLGRTRNPQMVG